MLGDELGRKLEPKERALSDRALVKFIKNL